jgi:hypothetical protein
LIYSAPLYSGRYLKYRLAGFVIIDSLERIISRSKSNNAASGSTSEDGMFGLSHKIRFAVPSPKLDMLTQFKPYIG